MNLRLANLNDLQQVKVMFRAIIQYMDQHDVAIWDDIYPCEFFEEDIKKGQLYVLEDDTILVGAFALCDCSGGADEVEWNDSEKKAVYIDRLGVNVNFLRQGMGSKLLDEAKKVAKSKHADYLRLFVVDINKPAIQLYERNGFMRAKGVYEEHIDDFILREYGYETIL